MPWAHLNHKWIANDRPKITWIHGLLATRGCGLSYQSIQALGLESGRVIREPECQSSPLPAVIGARPVGCYRRQSLRTRQVHILSTYRMGYRECYNRGTANFSTT